MMVSTSECKDFLVDMFSTNPDLLFGRFPVEKEERQELFDLVTDKDNWKRLYKCRPGKGENDFKEYLHFTKTTQLNRWGDPQPLKKLYPQDFVWERGFDCDPFEGQLAHVILTDAQGILYLADYIGD